EAGDGSLLLEASDGPAWEPERWGRSKSPPQVTLGRGMRGRAAVSLRSACAPIHARQPHLRARKGKYGAGPRRKLQLSLALQYTCAGSIDRIMARRNVSRSAQGK